MLTAHSARPVRVGIVGLSASGGFAAQAHLPALRALEGYEVRALSASTAESAQAAGRLYGVPRTFSTAAALARCEEVDLVVIAVKVPHHHELVTTAIEAGKAVLCEWPLGNGLAEAEELTGLARRAGVRTAVGLQARSAPQLRYLRDLVADGYVGEVVSTSVLASGGRWGPEVSAGSRYLIDPANGATMVTIPVGHTLDGITSVLGEFGDFDGKLATRRPQVHDSESGRTLPMAAADQVAITSTLDSGAVATMHYRGGSSLGTNLHWEINGTEGALVVTGASGHLQMGAITVCGGRAGDAQLAPLAVPDSYHRVPALAEHTDEPVYFVAHAYRQLLDDVDSGSSLVPDFDHALRRHRTIEAIRASCTGDGVTAEAHSC